MKHLSMISLITCLAFTPAGKQSIVPVEHPSSVQHLSSVEHLSFVEHPVILSERNQPAVKWVEVSSLTEANLQQQYFWFFYPGDYYWDHKSLADEINEMWMLYGAPVDTRPSGMLIDRGYISDVNPHITYPLVYLYVHY